MEINMKFCAVLIILFVMLTGCNNKKNNNISYLNTESIVEEENYILDENETAALEESWQTAYRKQLEEIINNKLYTEQVRHFSLYDLTNDDIPELIVSMGEHREGCSIYSFDNKIIDYGHFGSHSNMTYYPDKNILLSDSSESGVMSRKYYQTNKINNGTFSELEYLESYTPAEGAHQFKVDDKPVTKDEYQKASNKYTNENKISLGCNFELIEEILDVVFTDYKDWRECYKDLLYGMNKIYSQCRFSLYDISDDGIPELFISTDEAHAVGCKIYTFTDTLISLGELGSFGNCQFYPKKNILCSGYTGQGVNQSTLYQLNNSGCLTELVSFYDNAGTIKDTVYKVNEVEVTEADYNEVQNKYLDDNVKHLGRDFPFDEAVVDAIFNDQYDCNQ